MANNLQAVFPQRANISSVLFGGTANTKSDGAGTIGTDIYKVWTAGAVNSGNDVSIEKVRLIPIATVAATATAATVLRVFWSTKTSGATTSADTFLLEEKGAAAQTPDHSTNAIF